VALEVTPPRIVRRSSAGPVGYGPPILVGPILSPTPKRRGKGVSADRRPVSLAFQIEALPVAIVVHVSVSDRIVWNGTGETRTYPIEFQGFAKRRVLEGRFRIIAGR
jgi:hypothetical protein